MSRQIELLDKFYDNKATESEKRQLAGLLNDPLQRLTQQR